MPQSRVDLTGRILAVNPAMEAVLGEPARAVVGRNALSMYVEEDRAGLEAALADLASGRTHVLQQDRTLQLHDGRRLRVVMTVTAFRDADGTLLLAGSVEDVTALREAQAAQAVQAARFDALLRAAPVAVLTYDASGVCTSSRGRALRQLGVEDEALVGVRLQDSLATEPPQLAALLASLDGHSGHVVVDGGGRVWDAHYSPEVDERGTVVGGVSVSLDITERAVAEREVQAAQARTRALLRHASDVVLVLDQHARMLWVSPAVRQHFGYDERELLWKSGVSLDHPDDRPALDAAWRRALQQPGIVERCECRVLHADGTYRWTEHVFTNLLDDPDVGGVVVNLRDLSDRRRAELELVHQSLHDGLTGLANRGLLLDRIAQALVWARRNGTTCGLLLVDVVGTAALNTRLGQEGGDDVLRAVAARLVETARETDSVGRTGGDEFAVLVEDVASLEDLRARAAALGDALAVPVRVGDVEVPVRVRVSTTLGTARDAGALLAAAEQALAGQEEQPAVGRPVVGRVGPGSSATTAAADDLARGMEAGELRLHLQPVVQIDGPVVGAEALVRWEHPERGLLPPSEFVPLAEATGQVTTLGEWVLAEACRHAAQWGAAGVPYEVGVNLSPHQLAGSGVVDVVRRVLTDTGAAPEQLVLEVTESALMDDPGAEEVLRELRALGVRLALDDFGTGYSSLTYLKRFPVDAIKIDRSFVSGLGRDADDEAIVASVVSLGRAIGKTVVAEGVETVAQLDVLRSLGADRAQGFLWSPGLPPAQLDRWLALQATGSPAPTPAPTPSRPAAPERQPQDEDARSILRLHRQGASLHTIAAAMNTEGRRTTDGRRWTTTTVARVVAGLVRTT